MLLTWKTSKWAVALLEGTSFCAWTTHVEPAPATLLLTWNTSTWAVASLKGASFCFMTTHFEHLCCSSNFASQLERLQMSSCIGQQSICLCYFEHLDSSSNFVSHLEHLQMSSCIAQRSIVFYFDNAMLTICSAPATLFLIWNNSKWQFMLKNRIASATMFLIGSTSTSAVA